MLDGASPHKIESSGGGLNLKESKPMHMEHAMKYPTLYRTIKIDGLSIFYREAGPKDAPTLLLPHGFPSSSRMFEPLFGRLSDRYHLVAPDLSLIHI